MVKLLEHLKHTVTALAVTALFVPATTYAQAASDAKLDESLRESLERGCTGAQPVIVRTKPGYRQGLRDSLSAHGDVVKGEFPALDAVAADVHCEDLAALAGFDSTESVSLNGPVAVQSVLTDAQAALNAAKASLLDAKADANDAQKALRTAERALALADAQVVAAKKALVLAQRLNAVARPAAVAAAVARLAEAEGVAAAAEAAYNAARTEATAAQAAAMAASSNVLEAQQALAQASQSVASRRREGRAARDLKKKFFATMPLQGQISTIDESGNYTLQTGIAQAGSGVGVALIDSGIEPGLDFNERITAFYDFTLGDIRAVTPLDPFGHGTHVAGLIASEFVGVAPYARLVGLRVLDANGQGTTADVVRAIEFAIANRQLLGINILNLSLGHPIYEPAATDPLVQAVEHAAREGMVVVVSAGNFGLNKKTGLPGYAGIASPGNSPSALTAGATQTFNTTTRVDDRVAPYSSRGPSWYDGFAKPDFVAPGDNLLSVAAAGSKLRLAQEQRGNTGNYMRLSGTSMAAGVASGVVALVLQANSALTPNTVKAILEYSSIPVLDDLGQRYDALSQGAGQLEVTGAVALARAVNPQMPVGSPWLSTNIIPSTTIGKSVYTWSQSIIYGNRRLAGPTLLSEQRPAWAANIVWGEGLGSEDDNIVWGNNFSDDDNIVWGNSFDQDDNIVWGNNIVWGSGLIGMSLDDDNIVWGNLDDDNIVWGNLDDDNIVWGNLYDDNIVWGNSNEDDNIVWGNGLDDDNIVWGNSSQLGTVLRWSGGYVSAKASNTRARRTVSRKEGVQ